MTYREKLQTIHPEAISPRFMGGVENCPQDYFRLSLPDLQQNANECRACETSCRDCWNKEYKGEEPR
jgi:hypothetical protein